MEYSKFTLPPNFDFGILPYKDKKVCVVSFIGRSDLFTSRNKCSLVEELIGRNGFSSINPSNSNKTQAHHYGSNASLPETVHIEGFYHAPQRVIFLNLLSCHDTTQLVKLCEAITAHDTDLHDIGAILANEEFQFARALLYIFSVSHIVILSCLGTHFDPNYLRLLKLIDTMRKKLLAPMCSLLRSVQAMTREWASAARPCCPRLLLNFHLVPSLLTDNLTDEELAQLTTNVENQVFRVLRRSSLITNTTANCLFALPTVQGFAHVCRPVDKDCVQEQKRVQSEDPLVSALELDGTPDRANRYFGLLERGGLYRLSKEESDSDDADEMEPGRASMEDWQSVRGGGGLQVERSVTLSSLEKFLARHLEVARAGLYEERGPPSARHWELPTARTWFKVCHKLYSALLREPEGPFKVALQPLRLQADVGTRFSEARCTKALPIAESVYKEGLPQHYSKAFHLSKVQAAKRFFLTHARGPLAQRYLARLEAACDRVWMSGRQMCEVSSVTGHACTNEVHKLPEREESGESASDGMAEQDQATEMPQLPHKSEFKLRAACSCGRKQDVRTDPFNYREANVDFYNRLAEMCCARYQGISVPKYHGRAAVKVLRGGDGSSLSSQFAAIELDQKHMELAEHPASQESEYMKDDQKDEQVNKIPRPLNSMWHEGLSYDLLPVHQSWSVLAIGKYSSYSHSTGLDQPGFLHGSNYLLPWDVVVTDPTWLSTFTGGSGPRGGHYHQAHRRRGNVGDQVEVTVKVFFGFEYECPAGHRFFLATPDKMMKGAMQGGQVKEAVQRLLAGPLPLYFPCQCRATKGYMAQLMRVYVAVPSSPVHISLKLRVRPGPSGTPVFTPATRDPILLLPGELWVARLPFAYEDEKQVYRWPEPGNPEALEHCKLLEGAITHCEIPTT